MVVYNALDRLFEKGFTVQVREIVRSAPPTRQSLFFSATIPASLDLESALGDKLRMAFLLTRSVGGGNDGTSHKKDAALLLYRRGQFWLYELPQLVAALGEKDKKKSTKKGERRRRRGSTRLRTANPAS